MQYLMKVVLGGLIFGLIIFLWVQNYRIAQAILDLTNAIKDRADAQRELIDAQTDMIDQHTLLIDINWTAIEILSKRVNLRELKGKNHESP